MSDEDGIVGPGGCPPQPPDGGEQSPPVSPQGEQDRRDGRLCHPSVSGPPPVLADDGKAAAWLARFEQEQFDHEFHRITDPKNYEQRLFVYWRKGGK